MGTDIVKEEIVTDDGGHIPAQYQDCRIPVRYKDYVDICSKYMPTLAPHLLQNPKGILEDQRIWIKERR